MTENEKLIMQIKLMTKRAVEPPRKQKAAIKQTEKPTKQETVEVSNNEDELF